MLISFIIPHKGRENMLIDTLRSIQHQTICASDVEVIIVSQNATISDALTQLQCEMNLMIIFNQEQNTISHSRNVGAANAKGTYFAFLDADVYLATNWADVMLHALTTKKNTLLTSAMQVNSQQAPPLERIRTALSNAELDTNVSFLPGRNLFLHKDTFYEVGGFPEHLLTCEDYYFTDKVNKLGNLYYTSNTQYIHLGEDKAFVPMFKKEIWRGQSNLASLEGRHIPLREWPSFVVPFAVCGAFFVSLCCLVLSQFSLALLSLIVCCLPLMVYTLRLKRLTGSDVSILYCLWFYIVYFPARAMGTLLGVGGAVSTSSHK